MHSNTHRSNKLVANCSRIGGPLCTYFFRSKSKKNKAGIAVCKSSSSCDIMKELFKGWIFIHAWPQSRGSIIFNCWIDLCFFPIKSMCLLRMRIKCINIGLKTHFDRARSHVSNFLSCVRSKLRHCAVYTLSLKTCRWMTDLFGFRCIVCSVVIHLLVTFYWVLLKHPLSSVVQLRGNHKHGFL